MEGLHDVLRPSLDVLWIAQSIGEHAKLLDLNYRGGLYIVNLD